MIIDHTHPAYKRRWQYAGDNQHNGAYYYSKEIVKNIIPHVETDRSWITVNIPFNNREPQFDRCCCDHSIVFIHNNLNPEHYEWLKKYHDLVLICGIPETCDKVAHLGIPIHLPLSIDVEYVRQFERAKTKKTAYVGRRAKRHGFEFPPEVDCLEGMPRAKLLESMAEYEQIYAIGRTAIEARALGCTLLPLPQEMDDRFPDVERWQVLDNKEASVILQEKLNQIDGVIQKNG